MRQTQRDRQDEDVDVSNQKTRQIPIKKDFNKTEISNLPYKEFKVMILGKNFFFHLFREKNEWTQSELQQRDIKYKKVPQESHNELKKIQ